jgi:hypothetical protein
VWASTRLVQGQAGRSPAAIPVAPVGMASLFFSRLTSALQLHFLLFQLAVIINISIFYGKFNNFSLIKSTESFTNVASGVYTQLGRFDGFICFD